MAIFYCSECNFSKTVKDEMAGKKARCPKCNAVNTVLEIGQTLEDVLGESEAAAVDSESPVEAPAANETETTAANETETTDSEAIAETDTAKATVDETPAPEESTAPAKNEEPVQAVKFKISAGWLMAFGAALLPVVAGILMLCFRMVDPAMISFALGILAFGGLAAYYSFK